MVSFMNTFRNYALLGLLIFSILTFTIVVQETNNSNEKIIETAVLNNTYQNLNNSLSVMREQSQERLTLFQEEDPELSFGSLILFSVVSSGTVFTSLIFGVFNTLITLPIILFGINPLIFSVITAVLVLGFIVGLWVLYKLGG